MIGLQSLIRLDPKFVALEANTEQAGQALACFYSSSDEFEAAIIDARREAGIYGWPRRRRQQMLAASVAVALAVIVFIIV
jgi:hypothetical protein